MKTKLKAILHFLVPALEVRALKRDLACAHAREDVLAANLTSLESDYGDLQKTMAAAPSFIGAAIRDDKFGAEIAETVKAEAVKHLAPALSREYARILDQIAWKLPPPQRGLSGPPGSVLSALDERFETYRVRVELPQLNYDMQIASPR